MSDSNYHFVLVQGRFSRVVPETMPDETFRLERLGWEIVWDSARNAFEGHARAARDRRTVPEIWAETGFVSEPIQEPTTLYRSVSPGELESIHLTEEVTGRGNRFNEFDPRRLVFFGLTLTEGLTWHGEDLERQAMGIVSEREGTERWFDALAGRRRVLFGQFEAGYRKAVDGINAVADRTGRVRVEYREAEMRSIRLGHCQVSDWRLGFRNGLPASLAELGACLDESREEMEAVRKRYRSMVSDEIKELRAQAIDAPFTSAVLEFKPMDHGLRYFGPQAASGDGDGEEFGFFPGSVQLSDVAAVHWVRNREVFETTKPEAIGDWLELLREHREGAESVARFG